MAKLSGTRNLTAIVAIGAALSFGIGAALAADDVTEDQILKALTPTKKPLTRGLSVGGSAEPAANPAESKFVSSVRGRTAKNERKWPIRPLLIASRPLNSCDHEYWPVTIQTASSARLSAKVVPLRLAESV